LLRSKKVVGVFVRFRAPRFNDLRRCKPGLTGASNPTESRPWSERAAVQVPLLGRAQSSSV
jgi:hypothetical protein